MVPVDWNTDLVSGWGEGVADFCFSDSSVAIWRFLPRRQIECLFEEVLIGCRSGDYCMLTFVLLIADKSSSDFLLVSSTIPVNSPLVVKDTSDCLRVFMILLIP